MTNDQVRQKALVIGKKGKCEVMGCFRLSATETYLRSDIANAICDPIPLVEARNVKGLMGGDEITHITHFVPVELEVNGKYLDCCCRVVEELDEEIIIGLSNMRRFHIVLDLMKSEVVVEKVDSEGAR